MKFHHGQKVKIVNGYYKTFCGFINNFKENNDKVEYEVFIQNKDKNNREKPLATKWLKETDLKVSLF